MKAEPCRLPDLTMDAAALALWNAAIAHAERAFPLGGSDLRVTFRPVRPARLRPAFVLRIDERIPVLLQFHVFPFEALHSVRLGCEDVARMPAAIRAALERGMLDTLKGWLPDAIGARIGSAEPLKGSRLPDGLHGNRLSWLEFELSGPEDAWTIRCSVGLHPGDLAGLLGVDRIGRGSGPGLALTLKANPRVYLGTACLPMHEVRALAPGDLLVLDREVDATVLYVTAGKRCFVFSEADGSWTCRNVCDWPMPRSPREDERPMDTDDPTEEAPSTPESPALVDVPVTLEFDIGEMSVSYSEIEEWRPGSIVAIDPPRTGEGIEVRIRANGTKIAVGDLVRLGDRLAVRIHASAQPAAQPEPEPAQEGN